MLAEGRRRNGTGCPGLKGEGPGRALLASASSDGSHQSCKQANRIQQWPIFSKGSVLYPKNRKGSCTIFINVPLPETIGFGPPNPIKKYTINLTQ